MKILVDLEPRDVWRISEKAEHLGVTRGQVVRDELATRRSTRAVYERVRVLVTAGMCDADIAAELAYLPGTVAGIRRGLGLPANRRYRRKDVT